MSILFKQVKILTDDGDLVTKDVFVEKNKIKTIAKDITEQAEQTIDGQGKLLLPGLIDVHIHLREPGGEYKETIKTGTESAARGGFTTVCSMPNTSPVPDDVTTLTDILQRIEKDAVVRVLPYAAITKDLQGEELTPIAKLTDAGAFAFTDDGVGIQETDMMYQAMKQAAKLNMPIVAHCEDNSVLHGGVLHKGEVSERLNLPGILSISESVQIARDVLLAEATGCHYHVCHVSTKESVRVIRDAKRAGIRVTAEVSPHHLLLNENDIVEDDAQFKMNPPLRAEEDQEALLEGLLDGTIDFIATDHAPHSEEEKQTGFLEAPFGIVGLETAFPLMYTYLVKKGTMTLEDLVERMTKIPAQIFNLPYGTLAEHEIADLTLINLDAEKEINRHEFVSKGKNSPFHGWQAQGWPMMTIVAGKIVFKDDHID